MPTADHVRDGDIGKDSQKPEVSVAAAAAKSLQSCPTLCDPIDGSPPRLPHPWDSPGKNTGAAHVQM